MRRMLAVALAIGMTLTLFSGVASAHRFRKSTNLNINAVPSGPVDPGDKVTIWGKMKPRKCRAGQMINLYSRVPGPDDLLDTDRTDSDGEFKFVLHPTDDHRVRAVFEGSTEGGYGHNHRCKPSKSNTVPINV